MNKFVLRIEQVASFPKYDYANKYPGYAFVESPDLDSLARTISVHLRAEVVTDDGVYFPDITSLPPPATFINSAAKGATHE